MNFEFELVILPKEKTILGLSWNIGKADHNGKPTIFHEVGLGIGLIVLYLIIYKKGGN